MKETVSIVHQVTITQLIDVFFNCYIVNTYQICDGLRYINSLFVSLQKDSNHGEKKWNNGYHGSL